MLWLALFLICSHDLALNKNHGSKSAVTFVLEESFKPLICRAL
jgi:hypothetical protein